LKVTLEQFSGLVAGIYEAAIDGGRWWETVGRLMTAFDGNSGALLISAPDMRRVHPAYGAHDHAAVSAYNAHYGRLDPLAAVIERIPAGAVLCGTQIIAPEEHRRTEFYNDWCRPLLDCGDGVAANLVRGDAGAAWLCIGAPLRSQPFGSDERMKLMHLLVPHLQQAMRVQSSLADLDLQRQRALDALDRLAHAAVLLGSDGKVVFANRAADRLSSSGDGLSIGRNGVRAARRDDDAALQRLIGRAGKDPNGSSSGGTLVLARPSGRRPFVVHVLPAGTIRSDVASAGALAVIVDPEREPATLHDTLRRLYGLTPAEATAASEVLKGEGLQSVADRMSITISTVRIHLQRVFDKTQTHRQAELVRLLLTIDAGLELDCSSS
jgi:DNA-binding CsgD family transcriptional regulator/PAS domain-containing protein